MVGEHLPLDLLSLSIEKKIGGRSPGESVTERESSSLCSGGEERKGGREPIRDRPGVSPSALIPILIPHDSDEVERGRGMKGVEIEGRL